MTGFLYQYGYKLFRLSVTGGGKDPKGNPIPATETWVFVCDCRDEVNAKANYVVTADGGQYVYQALILCPKGTPALLSGTKIEVRDGATVRQRGEVKNCDPSRFHTRIWV